MLSTLRTLSLRLLFYVILIAVLTYLTLLLIIYFRPLFNQLTYHRQEIISLAWGLIGFSLILNIVQARKNQDIATHQKKMQAELDTAHHIQQAILPQVPKIQGYEISTQYQTATELGGDFYHFFQSGDYLGVVIGDVSGHGVSSALVMALFRGFMKEIRPEHLEPHALLKTLNHKLYETLQGQANYVTMVVASLNIKTGDLQYSRAGHPALIYFDEQKHAAQELETSSGSMLGIFEDGDFPLHKIQLQKNDLVLFYTDGLVEARNAQREFFGTQRLLNLLEGNASQNVDSVLKNIHSEISNFNTQLSDDRASILIRRV